MIENYDEVMAQWANPSVGTCTSMMEITPEVDLKRWAVQQTISILANADYYYTKDEVDNIISRVIEEGLTPQEVQDMINVAVRDKANQADLEALSAQVATNTADILNRYTKQETNTLLQAYLKKLDAISMRDNYSKVEGSTLILNSELEITI